MMELNEISTETFPFYVQRNKQADEDPLIHDIYFYIGVIAISIVGLFTLIALIKRCLKHLNKDQTVAEMNPSNPLLERTWIIQRQSSIRNPLTPNHRSSVDIRFQMESRERRLCH